MVGHTFQFVGVANVRNENHTPQTGSICRYGIRRRRGIDFGGEGTAVTLNTSAGIVFRVVLKKKVVQDLPQGRHVEGALRTSAKSVLIVCLVLSRSTKTPRRR